MKPPNHKAQPRAGKGTARIERESVLVLRVPKNATISARRLQRDVRRLLLLAERLLSLKRLLYHGGAHTTHFIVSESWQLIAGNQLAVSAE
jgi:hypothetical protein